MLQNFTISSPTTLVFGKDAELQVGELVKQYADKCLIHHDGGAYLESLLGRVRKSLTDAGVEIFELGGVEPNPKLSLMRKGMQMCKEQNIGFVLAIGGGSVMDSAKFIAIGAGYEGDVWNYDGSYVAGALPHGCICTLPGTGSEVSGCSMVVNDEGDHLVKGGFFGEQLKFDFSILNPELTYTLPAKQTAAGAVDVISHFMEAYFTDTEDAEMLWGVAETGVNMIMKNVKIVLDNPCDYSARANMMMAAYYASNDPVYIGTNSDWAVHHLENPLTTTFHSTHGLMLGIITPAWMKFCYKNNVPLFTRFCVNCLGAKMDFAHPEITIMEGIANFENFVKSIGLPTRLSEIGIEEKDFERVLDIAFEVRGGREKGRLGFVSKLTFDEAMQIYQLAK